MEQNARSDRLAADVASTQALATDAASTPGLATETTDPAPASTRLAPDTTPDPLSTAAPNPLPDATSDPLRLAPDSTSLAAAPTRQPSATRLATEDLRRPTFRLPTGNLLAPVAPTALAPASTQQAPMRNATPEASSSNARVVATVVPAVRPGTGRDQDSLQTVVPEVRPGTGLEPDPWQHMQAWMNRMENRINQFGLQLGNLARKVEGFEATLTTVQVATTDVQAESSNSQLPNDNASHNLLLASAPTVPEARPGTSTRPAPDPVQLAPGSHVLPTGAPESAVARFSSSPAARPGDLVPLATAPADNAQSSQSQVANQTPETQRAPHAISTSGTPLLNPSVLANPVPAARPCTDRDTNP